MSDKKNWLVLWYDENDVEVGYTIIRNLSEEYAIRWAERLLTTYHTVKAVEFPKRGESFEDYTLRETKGWARGNFKSNNSDIKIADKVKKLFYKRIRG